MDSTTTRLSVYLQRLHTGITVPLEKRVQWVKLEEASNAYALQQENVWNIYFADWEVVNQ
jgi:hypothetical protein